jgi:hypothetical protein
MLQNGHWRSVAVEVVSKPKMCHGAESYLQTDERVRVRCLLLICLRCSSKSKNRDKLFNYTVRVSVVVPVSELQMLVKAQSF